MTDKKATGQFLVRMDPDLHHELRRFTCDNGLSMREVVENSVGEYLRRQGVALHATSPAAAS
jgi:predicted HicB family RNase H-like nuclease